ncbi:hypothetical protein JKP88DRAFT_275642 [Tribonema minus]|uniref:Uncharacterized protein n=1 Tax=Tribonema minus TaxID=303371 RepID=A0A835ZBM1_9STRA|nr:hypothetical protein JKP88DRAFT_275642 [Tribonema minus]
MQLLLRGGAAVDALNTDRASPLHFAAQRGHLEACALLLDYGAKLNIQTSKGNTPLHYAAFFGRVEIARELIRRGADAALPNAFGKLAGMDCLRTVAEEDRKRVKEVLAQAANAAAGGGAAAAAAAAAAEQRGGAAAGATAPAAVDLQREVDGLQLTVRGKDREIARLAARVEALEEQLRAQYDRDSDVADSDSDDGRRLPPPLPPQQLQSARGHYCHKGAAGRSGVRAAALSRVPHHAMAADGTALPVDGLQLTVRGKDREIARLAARVEALEEQLRAQYDRDSDVADSDSDDGRRLPPPLPPQQLQSA